MIETNQELMSIDQFLKIYGISRSRVFNEMKSGRLKRTRLGGNVYIKRTDADAWLGKLEKDN